MPTIPTPFFDELINSQETTINVAGSGNFTGGSIKVVRVGNLVTISALTNITHASLSQALSAAGLIPSWARPSTMKENCYAIGSAFVSTSSVTPDGTLGFVYRDWAGIALNNTGTTTGFSISFTV